MYAVIRTGGKQYKVEAGEQLEVERLGLDDGSEVELAPVLVVDGDTVLATPGPARRRDGEGQGRRRDPRARRSTASPTSRRPTTAGAGATARTYSVIEITGITPAGAKK